MSDFSSLNLHPSILSALTKKGYTTPTPIQAQAIPHVIEGRDILGIAQTGTGKTAAFSLPIIHRMAIAKVKIKPARVQCLILTPTRELAQQIEDNISTYAKQLKISSKAIFGGVGYRPQVQAMSKGLNFLVATPGRLLDLMDDGHVLFEQLEYFILDEADRMLDMGFLRDVKKVIKNLPPKKQTLLFSATMPKDIAALSKELLHDPIRVEVTPESSTVEKISQSVCMVEKSNKPLLLKSILDDKEIKSVLVFTRTKHGADRVVKHLDRNGVTAAAIHGNKSQGARERALNGFRAQKLRVLVATDIAARGIDVNHVSHVINYHLPDDPKSYVHRIGRTARAGREGRAISFCDNDELKLLKGIEKTIQTKLFVDTEHEYHGVAPHISKQVQNKPKTKHIHNQKKKVQKKKMQSRNVKR
ncbi:DEAD/DEAH box helicase [Halobacteriovorax sp. HLS]|uniref:DEAD/DEAH box helicase n=1 Tax=Halobacteriovorax sp. HLS TaxID=2234000 RepID=UPI000FDCBFAE|nr:DEAD/DEAH box helicase [Halobacteriovorax sp. HLS]